MTTSLYKANCREWLRILKEILSGVDYGLLIGGGYGYDSLKYEKKHIEFGGGDLDLILFLHEESLELVAGSLSVPRLGNLDSIGFIDDDIRLFHDGQLDLIRLSYNFEDTKVSLKISTAIKFDKFLKGEKTFFTNSVHSNSYISIMGYGNKGTNIPICMLTPEISNEYSSKEQIRHFKFVDVLCYKVKDEYFAGLYLDFIAKGVVDHDLFSGELSELQDRALKIFKFFYQHGKVPVIYLFANNIYFGKKYKKNLNLRLENLMDTTIPPYCYDYVGDTLITLFTEPKDYYRVSLLEGLNKYNQESDRKNCHQIDFTVGLFTKESKRILSAEAKRLSIILSSADDSSKKMIKKIEVPLMRLWLHEDEGVLTLLDDSRISGKIYQDESLVKAINSLRSDCLSFIRYTHK